MVVNSKRLKNLPKEPAFHGSLFVGDQDGALGFKLRSRKSRKSRAERPLDRRSGDDGGEDLGVDGGDNVAIGAGTASSAT